MNVVIPMAGRGARFAAAGYSAPKPMIEVRGEPMYAWAMKSVPLAAATRLVFVCLDEHLRDRQLAQDIKHRYGAHHPTIVPLSRVTEGQACTVLEAMPALDPAESLLVYNADTYQVSPLAETLAAAPPRLAGLLSVFEAPGDQWSFARVDAGGRVVETAEKRRISQWASTGMYWFRSIAEYARYAREMIERDLRVNGEFYVAPLYNLMIRDGLEVRTDVAREVWVLGTPEGLARFEERFPQ